MKIFILRHVIPDGDQESQFVIMNRLSKYFFLFLGVCMFMCAACSNDDIQEMEKEKNENIVVFSSPSSGKDYCDERDTIDFEVLIDTDSTINSVKVSIRQAVFAEILFDETFLPAGTQNTFRFSWLADAVRTHVGGWDTAEVYLFVEVSFGYNQVEKDTLVFDVLSKDICYPPVEEHDNNGTYVGYYQLLKGIGLEELMVDQGIDTAGFNFRIEDTIVISDYVSGVDNFNLTTAAMDTILPMSKSVKYNGIFISCFHPTNGTISSLIPNLKQKNKMLSIQGYLNQPDEVYWEMVFREEPGNYQLAAEAFFTKVD